MVILLYDVWMSNIIVQGRYRHWPEIKILINVSKIAAIVIDLCYYVINIKRYRNMCEITIALAFNY